MLILVFGCDCSRALPVPSLLTIVVPRHMIFCIVAIWFYTFKVQRWFVRSKGGSGPVRITDGRLLMRCTLIFQEASGP